MTNILIQPLTNNISYPEPVSDLPALKFSTSYSKSMPYLSFKSELLSIIYSQCIAPYLTSYSLP